MTLALLELGSNSEIAFVKASAWLVLPPADRASTAFFSVATEVISWVSCTAVLEKLTMPMRLPEPISPDAWPPVDSEMISINVLAPVFMLASGSPVMLPDRSSTRAMSVGLVTISGAAVSARVTFRDPSQSMRSILITLLELVIPIVVLLPSGGCPITVYVTAVDHDTIGRRRFVLFQSAVAYRAALLRETGQLYQPA